MVDSEADLLQVLSTTQTSLAVLTDRKGDSLGEQFSLRTEGSDLILNAHASEVDGPEVVLDAGSITVCYLECPLRSREPGI